METRYNIEFNETSIRLYNKYHLIDFPYDDTSYEIQPSMKRMDLLITMVILFLAYCSSMSIGGFTMYFFNMIFGLALCALLFIFYIIVASRCIIYYFYYNKVIICNDEEHYEVIVKI